MQVDEPLLLIDIHHSGYFGWGVWRGDDAPERWTAETVKRLMRHCGYKMGLNLGAQTYENSPRFSARIREWLRRFPDRLFVTGGDYAQLTACVRTGESNIRQLLVGLQTIADTLGVRPTVWTMSEPGNFAQLPQVLSDLGYRGALLRIHGPGQGGSPTTTIDAGVVAWEGPDGMRIAAVPEYASDRASVGDDCPTGMWMMTRYRNDKTPRGGYTLDDLLAWRDRMAEAGVRPVVMSKDDDHNDQPANTNWCMRSGHLLAADTEGDPRFRWVTGEELFAELPGPDTVYGPEPDLFETRKRSFCDYGHTGNRDWVADLQTEESLHAAEFASALAAELGHKQPDAEDTLDAAWRLHLGAQNHDLSLSSSRILMYHLQYEAQRLAAEAEDRAIQAIVGGLDTSGGLGAVVVFNPLARDRRDYATVTLPAELAQQAVLCDDEGGVPWEPVERSAELVTMGFVAEAPSLGWRRYLLRAGSPSTGTPGVRVEGAAVHTAAYSVAFRDGGIEALMPSGAATLVEPSAGLAGDIAREACRGGGAVEIDASGPLSVVARERGPFGRFHRYTIDYRMTPGLPYLRVSISVTADHFDGTPGAPGAAGDPSRKLEYSLRWRGQACSLRCVREQPMLIARYNAAISPIFAAPWWVDYGDGDGGAGLAIFNRGAIGQRWDVAGGEMNVILGSGDVSELSAELALYPHRGDWRAAEANAWGRGFGMRLRAVYEPPHGGHAQALHSVAAVEPTNVTVSAVFRKQGRTYLRLWEHAGAPAAVRLLRNGAPRPAQRVTLELAERDGGSAVGPHAIATFRIGA